MKNIAILASGSGSNAENIYNFFKDSSDVCVKFFLTNNPDAYVKKRAKNLGVECQDFTREFFNDEKGLLKLLLDNKIDYIVLAGFLWLLPSFFIAAYKERIVNIHPSLLPKYGGKGFFGDKVHKAVVEAGDALTGITVHKVDENYDSGMVIEQVTVSVEPSDTYEQVAAKVHALEYEHFPRIIAQELKKF
ncbi:MAG: phosphoribosylglycinamide formyltransferase [Rikenellaceae bacterium]